MPNRPNFVERYMNPGIFPVIDNQDGSVSTHRMAAEVDENGNWLVFPTVVQKPSGELEEFEDPFEAMRYAKKTGEYIDFKGDKDDAINFAAGGYKKPETRANKKAYDQAHEAGDLQKAYDLKRRARLSGVDTSKW